MNINILDMTLDELASQNDELCHHGIKGMKWGVRRTPAQLGHKTSGKKKASKAKSYVDKLMEQRRAKSAAKKAEKASKKAAKKAEDEARKEDLARQKKPISKMSDTELAEYNIRKANELRALQIDAQINQLQPQQVSRGKQFADEIMGKATSALADGAGNAVKSFMQNAIDKALGQGAYDPLNKLKKEAEKAGYAEKISKAAEQEIKTERARWSLEKDKKGAADAAAKERKEADEAARKANEERSKWEYEQGRESWKQPSYERNPSWDKTSAGNSSSSSKVYTGEIIPGYSTKKTSTTGSKKTPLPVIDITDYEVVTSRPTSSFSSSTRSLGQSYVSGYLSAPASSSSSSTRALGQSYIAGYLPAPKDDD